MSSLPNTLGDIITKVRRITGRPSVNQISDNDIIKYINTFYVYDMPESLRLESLRVNYQFLTSANIPAYDFPTDLYLTAMPPVYIANYQCYMTQSRENFFRINPELNFLQQSVYTGNGGISYSGQFLTNLPILPGFKRNPPGAYSPTSVPAKSLNWNVMVSALGTPDSISGISPAISLVDDGLGNLFDITDTILYSGTPPFHATNARGSINYITGAINITNFRTAIPVGNAINVQYVPYVASRPQTVVFYQDQILVYPIPDQAYNVSFEAYMYPTAFAFGNNSANPQLNEWWQLLAYGAADKIFSDNGDFENLSKYRDLLKEQMNLMLRRTIVQQTSERVSTIYTEQNAFPSYGFGNVFSGF